MQQLEGRIDVASGTTGTQVWSDVRNALDTTPDDDGARMLTEPDGGRAGTGPATLAHVSSAADAAG